MQQMLTRVSIVALALALLATAALGQSAAENPGKGRLEAHRHQLAVFLDLLQTRGTTQALAQARAAVTRTQKLGERDTRRGDAMEHMALALQATGAWEECLRTSLVLVALRKAERPAEPELVALALGVLAVAQFGVGKAADADRSFSEQLALYRTAYPAHDVRLAQKLELHATGFLTPNAKHRAAIAALREALAIRSAQARTQPAKLAEIHQSIALNAIALADYETADRENLDAERWMRAAITAAPDDDALKAGLVQMLVVHAGQEIRRGADNGAAALIAQARALQIKDKALESEGRLLAFVVEAQGLERRGDFAGARSVIGEALTLVRRLDPSQRAQDDIEPGLLQILGELSLRQDDVGQARRELDEAMRLSGGEAEADAGLLLVHAEVARRDGKPEERRRLYQLALARMKLGKSEVPILYATNRTNTHSDGRPGFGASVAKAMSFGEAVIDVPGGQFSDQSQLAAYQKAVVPVGLSTNAHQLSIAKVVAMPDADALHGAIRARLSQARLYARQALLFVHGYNNTFEHALRRAAQLARDLNFDGPVLVFAWPSQGSFLHYGTDKDAAKASITALAGLLDGVMRAMDGEARLHVIAHSMGNRVLLPALTQTDVALKGMLGEVILASPAIDIAAFHAALGTLVGREQGRYTLYASRHDRALYTGYFREFGTNLAGFVTNGEPVLHRGLDSIDVSEAGNIGDRLDYNHDIFATNPVITEDMRQLIQARTRPPGSRLPNLLAKTGVSGEVFWVYKRPD